MWRSVRHLPRPVPHVKSRSDEIKTKLLTTGVTVKRLCFIHGCHAPFSIKLASLRYAQPPEPGSNSVPQSDPAVSSLRFQNHPVTGHLEDDSPSPTYSGSECLEHLLCMLLPALPVENSCSTFSEGLRVRLPIRTVRFFAGFYQIRLPP